MTPKDWDYVDEVTRKFERFTMIKRFYSALGRSSYRIFEVKEGAERVVSAGRSAQECIDRAGLNVLK